MATSLAHPRQGGTASAELVSLSWQRIQLIIRLRPTDGPGWRDGALVLRREDDARARCDPVGIWSLDKDLVARFNVMLGPNQMPLEPGRWVLSLVSESNIADLRLSGTANFDPRNAIKSFGVPRGEFRFRPVVDTNSSFMLEVRLDPRRGTRPTGRSQDARRVRAILGPVRRLRRRGSRLLFKGLRLLARGNGRRILFMSKYGTQLTDNLKLVYDRMVERGLDREYELLTLTKPGLTARSGLRDRLLMPWLLARADTLVIDKNRRVLRQGGAQHLRIIQLWHASGAFKTFGYSRIGRPRGPSPWSRDHKNYTYAIVSGEHEVPMYAEAFGIAEERVVPTGTPRMDRFFDESARRAGRAAVLAAFPQARGRMVILFAPTFRGRLRVGTYDLGRLDLARLHELCLEKDAVFIIRLHPHVRQRPDIPPAFRDRLLDGSSTVMGVPDLLFAADLLITDYSSIVFEYSTLGRPMLFYAYDLAEYMADRDVYEPYEEFAPGKIVRTFDELVEAIRRDDYEAEKVAPFVSRHFTHRDGRATDRVIDLIVGR